MTPEKTYQHVCEMLYSYDSATGNDAAAKLISDPSDFLSCFNPFYESAAALLLDARERMDKKASSASVVSAIKRMTKAAVARGNKYLQGMVYQNGMYCVFCDNCRIVRLKDDVACVPHIENTPFTPNLANYMKQAIEEKNQRLDLPQELEVKAYIARCKAVSDNGHTYSYQLAENVYVNPQYLLDMLQALPGCTCYTDADKAEKAMLYFVADNGDGVLLPVNPTTAVTL